jgi:DNA helicase-2/ATP-dependent DNA helicase PcrA
VRADGPVPALVAHADDEAEARGVVHVLRDAHRHGMAWRDMAVLFRTNAQSVLFERACTDAGVPFAVAPRGRFLDRAEVQVLLERLRQTEQAAPNRPLHDHLADLEAWADDEDPDELQRAAATMLAALGRDYLDGDGMGRGTLPAFLTWAELTTRTEPPPGTADRVSLLTFHRAKGLEWSVVCVTGLEDGFVPIAYADTDAARTEERRLLHVALSRAHERLHLSYARRRTLGGRGARREPSPWLDAPIAASVPGPADRVPDPRDALDAVRRTLAAARPPQEQPRFARKSSR